MKVSESCFDYIWKGGDRNFHSKNPLLNFKKRLFMNGFRAFKDGAFDLFDGGESNF